MSMITTFNVCKDISHEFTEQYPNRSVLFCVMTDELPDTPMINLNALLVPSALVRLNNSLQ